MPDGGGGAGGGDGLGQAALLAGERAGGAGEHVQFSAVALLEIATDKLDTDRFKQLKRRTERALMTRYNSRIIQ